MKVYILLLSFILSVNIFAQSSSQLLNKGNKKYGEGKYNEAEILFRRALESNDKWVKEAMYNMANSLYKQNNYEEAEKIYSQIASNSALNNNQKSQLFHNLGNSQLLQEKYKESIDSYKKALRINPTDEDTRYNISYAISKLQQQENDKNQDNKDNKDKDNKDNKDNQDNQDNQDNKDNKDNQEDNKEKKQEKQQDMSQKDLERILNALSNQDSKILDKMREENMEKGVIKTDKDW
jgi:tetratricopeptide (TPR) repeat protein